MVSWKKILICMVLIVSIVVGIAVITFNNDIDKNIEVNAIEIEKINEIKEEYIPQEEISDAQIRQTMISLYFKDDKGIIPEVRYIDVKDLIEKPYEQIIKLLIDGPKTENLKKTIPEGTKINKIEKKGDKLIVELSKEFVLNQSEEDKKIAIESIENTLTQFIEVNEVIVKSND